MSSENRKAIIVGTAQSWKLAPWTDANSYIVSLNDAYALGVPRAEEWFEQHPLSQMWFRPKDKHTFREDEIPKDKYVRPEGHIEWLRDKAKTIPVWLQDAPPDGWPVNASRFPIEDILEKYGMYWASGPSYMLMHLYDRGFRQFGVYGIHLATEREYIEQRPNWEFCLGRILGARIKQTERDGKRYYEGENATVELPKDCPILAHGWRYAYEKRPVAPDWTARKRLGALQREYQKLTQAVIDLPRWKSKKPLLDQMARVRAEMRDAQLQGKHALVSAGAI